MVTPIFMLRNGSGEPVQHVISCEQKLFRRYAATILLLKTQQKCFLCYASSLIGKSNTRVELQYKMADSGKKHTKQSEHVSMTKLSTADRYWRNLSFLMYKGVTGKKDK